MASSLKFPAPFQAADRASDTLSKMGLGLSDMGRRAGEANDRIQLLSDRMTKFGKRTALVGAVVSEGADKLRDLSERIADSALSMDQALARLSAQTGITGKQIDDIRRRAIEFSSTHPGVTARQWVDGFTHLRDAFQDTTKAMAGEDVAGMLSKLGVDSRMASDLIGSAFSNLGADARTVGDEFTRTIQLFGLANPEQFAISLGQLARAAKATDTSLPAIMALAGQAQQLITGGHGAEVFSSAIQQFVSNAQKTGANLSGGLIPALERVRQQIVGLTDAGKVAALRQLGFGEAGSQILPLLDNLGQVETRQKQIAASAGALGKAYRQATGDAADQMQLLHQNVNNLYAAVARPALPTLNSWLKDLTGATRRAAGAAEKHSSIARMAALSITALGMSACSGIQALSTLGAASFFAGQSLKALRGLASVVPNVFSFAGGLRRAVPSVLSFGAVLAANPLTFYVAGALALAAAAYEIYEHWGAIASFFEGLWNRIRKVFDGIRRWIQHAGLEWMKNLGAGILAGLEYPFKAAWHVAEKMGGLFIHHSPPREGPLREAIVHFRFGQELARHLSAAPVVGRKHAMEHRVAGFQSTQAAAGAVTINLHYAPTINGGGSSPDWAQSARQHADELVRILESKLNRRNRLRFA